MKKIKTVLMVMCLIMVLHVHTLASAIPIVDMPFVPPMEVQLYDMLFNSSGVTAIEESDEQKRLEAYLDLFSRALGTGAEGFLNKMTDILQNAKTSRQITLDSTTAGQLQSAVKYALEVGYEVNRGSSGFTREEVSNKLRERIRELFGVSYVTQSNIEAIVDMAYEARSGIIFHGYSAYKNVTAGVITNLTDSSFHVPHGLSLTFVADYAGGGYYLTNRNNSQFNSQTIYEYYPTLDAFMDGIVRKQVSAKDTATQQAISVGKNAILTPDSTLTESNLLDTTKPIVINIYRNITYPATKQEDIEEKQRELVVTNISTDEVAITQKETLEDIRTETYGDTEAYKLDLLSFFPFCIPRDVMMLLQAFAAEPQTPEFDIPFPTWENGQMTTMNYTISLAQFESLAAALRIFECVAFMIGLLVVTRQKYLRG